MSRFLVIFVSVCFFNLNLSLEVAWKGLQYIQFCKIDLLIIMFVIPHQNIIEIKITSQENLS